ncbi:hypothetical protein N9L49_04190 [Rhodospirillales bacterium]|nr:hypothetical protein [Rhodospirillales bacterium]
MTQYLRTFPLAAGAVRDAAHAFAVAAFSLPERGVDVLVMWEKRLKDRDALSHMKYGQLEDMGISPEDALIESEKPFWRS